MRSPGPRNIGLTTILRYRFPLAAVASILHRISGVILFLLIPFVLWMLHLSLSSQMQFLMVKDFLASPAIEFFMWLLLSALFYHIIAGIKHLLMDMGYFEEKFSARLVSLIVIILGLVGAVGIGVWVLC